MMVAGNLVGYTFGISRLDVLLKAVHESFTLPSGAVCLMAISLSVNIMIYHDWRSGGGKGDEVEMKRIRVPSSLQD
jgi:hypothetical protein